MHRRGHYFLGQAEGERESLADQKPILVTVGIPGFNVQVPLVSRERFWLALGLSVTVGVVGGVGLAKWLNRAQV